MEEVLEKYEKVGSEDVAVWFKACRVTDIPKNGGACVKYKDKQIALYQFDRKGAWYACQNLCPHKMEMVLSRGMLGDHEGIAKVACPMHKKTFSLETGENLNGELPPIAIYPVKIEDGHVLIGFKD